MGKKKTTVLPPAGLLSPVTSTLPPTDIPDPSRYLPTNSHVGSDYNLLAQVLAHGQSPGAPGTPQYYSQASFRGPDGQLGGMAKYAPAQAMAAGNRGGWEQPFWQQFLRNEGVGRKGNAERMSPPAPSAPNASVPPTNWAEWLKSQYPNINFGGLGGGNPPSGGSPMQPQIQALLQMLQRR